MSRRALLPWVVLGFALAMPHTLRADEGGGAAAPGAPGPAPDLPPVGGTDAPPPPVEPPQPPPEKSVDSLKAGDAKKHVYHLASNKFMGRASGLEGCDLAGEYLIENVKEWGLLPKGEEEGSYKQHFEVKIMPFPGQPPPKDRPAIDTGRTFNVCAYLPGADEKLRDEVVVLSAHYDHTGARDKKKIWYGADDNASGTSTLLEVAQAFSLPEVPRPRRSVLFLWVSGEERGLLGSKHYVDHPTLPLSQIVCDLNIDMVGRNESKEMHVYGNASSPELDTAHRNAAEASGLKFTAKTGSIFRRSDQYNFYEKDIPCLFWTSGLHKDYHTPKDEAKRIDYGKVERAARHAYLTAWAVANLPVRPSFVKMDAAGSAGRLGAVLVMIQPEEVPQAKLGDGEGIALVQSVLEGMPAFDANLKEGDLILEVDGKALPDHDPVGAVEDGAQNAKSKVQLRVLRGTKRYKITVKFD